MRISTIYLQVVDEHPNPGQAIGCYDLYPRHFYVMQYFRRTMPHSAALFDIQLGLLLDFIACEAARIWTETGGWRRYQLADIVIGLDLMSFVAVERVQTMDG